MPSSPGADGSSFHGTCVARGSHGLLIAGTSGSGKSDLALRLLAGGWRLVADDRVILQRRDGLLIAQAPETIRGLIEVRGIGVVRLRSAEMAEETRVAGLLRLVPDWQAVPRMPEAAEEPVAGASVPALPFHPFELSAPLKAGLFLDLILEPERRVE